MSDIEVIVTSDGSNSIFNSLLNETYHSRHGAIQESLHVFIRSGLEHFIRERGKEEIRILEVGLGTGLNALLTLKHVVNTKQQIYYFALEPYPLDSEILKQLNYSGDSGDVQMYFNKLYEAAWEVDQEIALTFKLHKTKTFLQKAELPKNRFDVIYFDAFAPNKQPEMWEMEVLRKVTEAMTPGAVLVTYCARGQFKRDLQSLNLKVETLPGPPGKKEMVRASK
ncbi:MAG TPA: tRNA (5-methylaminomethyl-2-thiouridine)(34)-methyltransferase MnmD [Cyclobacteriaceae bacterium]|nr:tRNA (5-methylaminomethyl-2-thiouridine)(34)-methyltransferase MnmD [Cyclobacteriaceae bacterium]